MTQETLRRCCHMSKIRIVALILIVAGILGLVYGQFTYTKETHKAKLGPLEIQVKEKEAVNVPTWAGVGAIAAGVILLLKNK
jgi:hypothetical protein